MDNNTNMIPLGLDDSFSFSCSENLPCFNECCKDLNQFLTPYDILCLKNRLGMPSGPFLEKYTSQHTGPESGLPVITFKTDYTSEYKCPFVTPKGCSIYESRPSSCRAYPLVRVVSRSRATGAVTEQYMLLKEPHCLGFNQEQTQTVREWIESQGITVYNQINDMLMQIIGLKNRLGPGRLDDKSRRLFYMAGYDLDTFRTSLFEGKLDIFDIGHDTLDTLKNDDLALLKFGLKWIQYMLFGVK